MNSVIRRSLAGSVSMSVFVLAGALMFCLSVTGPEQQAARAEATDTESATQVKDTYVGITKCAACHFREYQDWQTTPHGNAFKTLPEKYKSNAECLECHTSRISEPSTGGGVASSHASGVSCESCHGPGGDHANYALSFVGRDRVFTEDELELLRSKIQALAVDQCIKCHTSKSHKPHPEFDREPMSADKQAGSRTVRGAGFFDAHGGSSN